MPGITQLTRPGAQGWVNVRFNHGLLETQMRFRGHVSIRWVHSHPTGSSLFSPSHTRCLSARESSAELSSVVWGLISSLWGLL